MLSFRTRLVRLPAMLVIAAGATAQGAFVNFETPQVKPITTATVAGTEFLLVCNTPDNSVELYDPNTGSAATPPVYIDRVPVGQGPASVRFDPATACFYTANYIGDSVTKVQLSKPGATLQWRLVATKTAGEAPADLALSADGATLFVTLADASRLATLDAATLEPLAPASLMLDPAAVPALAVKDPRRIEIRNGARWILNMKGGNLHAPHAGSPPYDLDLWTFDPATATTHTAGRLGTSNAGMAFGADGKLYVVGSLAHNEVADEPNVQALAAAGSAGTGFVESWLWVVDPNGAAPAVTTARNLNLDTSGAALAPPVTCSQPMDVALIQNANAVTKIYVATFGSDRLVVLTPNAGSATTWSRSVIDLPITPVSNSYGRNGPRGLAVNAAQTRLYCTNQLSNSISVVDLSNDTQGVRVALHQDPTPGHVRAGRRFLYSAEFSGNQTVACSSCHVDARTDALGWDLGTPAAGTVPHPPGLDDTPMPPFAADKGILVTQSLQGLVNHPVTAGQDSFSNKPYHWRGDRADFEAFNVAFIGLMAIRNPAGPDMGISAADMTVYRNFIDTVMYTPNPEQANNRVFRGTLGSPGDLTSGTLAMRGLKNFHTRPQARCGGRSCAQCHSLPEGSNNRITVEGGVGGLETAALRSRFQLEGRAEAVAAANQIGASNVMTSHFGLIHDGNTHQPAVGLPPGPVPGPASIDRFVLDNFGPYDLTNPFAPFVDIALFLREMDTGVAPSVGVTHTVTVANKGQGRTTAAFDLLEQQVRKANCGFAIHARIGGASTGYHFDISGATEVYREHGTSNTFSRAQLLLLVVSAGPDPDVLVLQGTPAGSERRIASVSGTTPVLPGPAAQNVTLQPMRPASQWVNVPLLTKNWDPFDPGPDGFHFTGGPTPLSLTSLRILQRALIQFAPGFGLTQLRHEAPRRFAVAGDDIRLGARLQLRVPAPTVADMPPPYVDVVANTTLLEMALFPTDQFVAGRRVWETTVEADPLLTYTLLMGGESAPGVADVLDNLVVESLTYPVGKFDPQNWNLFHVTVVNENNAASAGSWQTLTIQ